MTCWKSRVSLASFGRQADCKSARLKYHVAGWGMPAHRALTQGIQARTLFLELEGCR